MLHLELAQIKCIPRDFPTIDLKRNMYLGFSSRSKGGGFVGEPGTYLRVGFAG